MSWVKCWNSASLPQSPELMIFDFNSIVIMNSFIPLLFVHYGFPFLCYSCRRSIHVLESRFCDVFTLNKIDRQNNEYQQKFEIFGWITIRCMPPILEMNKLELRPYSYVAFTGQTYTHTRRWTILIWHCSEMHGKSIQLFVYNRTHLHSNYTYSWRWHFGFRNSFKNVKVSLVSLIYAPMNYSIMILWNFHSMRTHFNYQFYFLYFRAETHTCHRKYGMLLYIKASPLLRRSD